LRITVLALSAVLAAVAAAGCTSGSSATATTTGRSFAERIEGKPGLSNFARIDERLYRGAQPTAEGYRTLKQLGVKTVINFRSHHSYKKDIEAAGLACVEMPIQADVIGSEPPTDEQLKLFFDTVLDPGRQPVFIHCMKGCDRTGTLSAVYRMEVQGWTTDEAMQEMHAFGFNPYYADLKNFVRGYQPRGFTSRK
jgi:protein tyrosine/serine phosphatase